MKIRLSSAACAAALLLASVSGDAILSAASAQQVSVGFNSFHDQLSNYGAWVYSDRWGEVWIPNDVPDDFHPYGSRGHWAYSGDYGWTWASDYEWGDIPFHYGRWVNDPDDGWLWIPGYVWSPGWVVWRHNGEYTGWMPMPPDDEFLGRRPRSGASIEISIGGLSVNFNDTSDDYGYRRWYGRSYDENRFASNWFFIGTGHMAERDYGRYRAPRNNNITLVRNTTNITNYTVVNNYVVNRSVDVRDVERASGGRRVEPVPAAQIFKKPQFVTRADTGAEVQQRARMDRPRGSGEANSAPKPTPAIVQSLSTTVKPRAGRPPAHLYTRDTVDKAPLVAKPDTGPGTANPAMTGPDATGGKDRGKKGPNDMTGPGNRAMTGPGENDRSKKGPNAMTGPGATNPIGTDQSKKGPNDMTGPGAASPNETDQGKKGPIDKTGPGNAIPNAGDRGKTGPNDMSGKPDHAKPGEDVKPVEPATTPEAPKRHLKTEAAPSAPGSEAVSKPVDEVKPPKRPRDLTTTPADQANPAAAPADEGVAKPKKPKKPKPGDQAEPPH